MQGTCAAGSACYVNRIYHKRGNIGTFIGTALIDPAELKAAARGGKRAPRGTGQCLICHIVWVGDEAIDSESRLTAIRPPVINRFQVLASEFNKDALIPRELAHRANIVGNFPIYDEAYIEIVPGGLALQSNFFCVRAISDVTNADVIDGSERLVPRHPLRVALPTFASNYTQGGMSFIAGRDYVWRTHDDVLTPVQVPTYPDLDTEMYKESGCSRPVTDPIVARVLCVYAHIRRQRHVVLYPYKLVVLNSLPYLCGTSDYPPTPGQGVTEDLLPILPARVAMFNPFVTEHNYARDGYLEIIFKKIAFIKCSRRALASKTLDYARKSVAFRTVIRRAIFVWRARASRRALAMPDLATLCRAWREYVSGDITADEKVICSAIEELYVCCFDGTSHATFMARKYAGWRRAVNAVYSAGDAYVTGGRSSKAPRRGVRTHRPRISTMREIIALTDINITNLVTETPMKNTRYNKQTRRAITDVGVDRMWLTAAVRPRSHAFRARIRRLVTGMQHGDPLTMAFLQRCGMSENGAGIAVRLDVTEDMPAVIKQMLHMNGDDWAIIREIVECYRQHHGAIAFSRPASRVQRGRTFVAFSLYCCQRISTHVRPQGGTRRKKTQSKRESVAYDGSASIVNYDGKAVCDCGKMMPVVYVDITEHCVMATLIPSDRTARPKSGHDETIIITPCTNCRAPTKINNTTLIPEESGVLCDGCYRVPELTCAKCGNSRKRVKERLEVQPMWVEMTGSIENVGVCRRCWTGFVGRWREQDLNRYGMPSTFLGANDRSKGNGVGADLERAGIFYDGVGIKALYTVENMIGGVRPVHD